MMASYSCTSAALAKVQCCNAFICMHVSLMHFATGMMYYTMLEATPKAASAACSHASVDKQATHSEHVHLVGVISLGAAQRRCERKQYSWAQMTRSHVLVMSTYMCHVAFSTFLHRRYCRAFATRQLLPNLRHLKKISYSYKASKPT